MAECLELDAPERKVPDVVFVRPRQARLLQGGPAKIVLITLREIDKIIAELSQCDSRKEFCDLRKKRFADYANLSYIMANLFSAAADRPTRKAAINQALKTTRHFFEVEGASRLGMEVVGECAFCIDTLRRAYRLVDVIHSRGNPPADKAEQDRKLANDFNTAVLWAQMHLDCLRFVVMRRAGVGEAVLEEWLQGLRFAVMAYAYVRSGVALRTTPELEFVADELDEEDRELLDESFEEYKSSLDESESDGRSES